MPPEGRRGASLGGRPRRGGGIPDAGVHLLDEADALLDAQVLGLGAARAHGTGGAGDAAAFNVGRGIGASRLLVGRHLNGVDGSWRSGRSLLPSISTAGLDRT